MRTSKNGFNGYTALGCAVGLLGVGAIVAAACGGSGPGSEFPAGAGGAASTTTGSGGGLTTGPGTGGTVIIGTGGSGTGDGGVSDGPNRDAGDACGLSSIKAENKVVNILLVIDKSGSMSSTPMGFSTDKWSALKTALSGALDQVKGGISFGLELFPNSLTTPIPTNCVDECWDIPAGDSAVVVPIGPGTTTVPQIVTQLGPPPAGGTPTAAALKLASDYFTTGAGASLMGDKYVLLATDGGPNGNPITCTATTCTKNIDLQRFTTNYCDSGIGDPNAPKNCLDDQATVAQLSAMATAGLKTFVVGIPGTEVYTNALDAMAVAGGVPASTTSPKYYAVSASGGVAGLQQVFESITKQVITTCRQQLQSNPPDLSLLNVYVDGKLIPQGGADGWTIDTSTSPPTIVLEGATCAGVQMNGAMKIEVIYGCPTIIVN